MKTATRKRVRSRKPTADPKASLEHFLRLARVGCATPSEDIEPESAEFNAGLVGLVVKNTVRELDEQAVDGLIEWVRFCHHASWSSAKELLDSQERPKRST